MDGTCVQLVVWLVGWLVGLLEMIKGGHLGAREGGRKRGYTPSSTGFASFVCGQCRDRGISWVGLRIIG